MNNEPPYGALLLNCLCWIGLIWAAYAGFTSWRRRSKERANPPAAALGSGSESAVVEAGGNPTPKSFATDLRKAKVYDILMPRGMKWQPDRAKAFLDHLLLIFGSKVVLQVVAEPSQVTWRILDCRALIENTDFVVNGIKSIYPECEVSVDDYRPNEFARPIHRRRAVLKLTNAFYAPMKLVGDIKDSDPVAAVIAAMTTDLRPGCRVTYTLYLTVVEDQVRQWGKDQIKQWNVHPLQFLSAEGAGNAIGKALSGNLKTDKFIPELQKRFLHKLNNEILAATFIVMQMDVATGANYAQYGNALTILLAQYWNDLNGLGMYEDKRLEEEIEVTSAEQDQKTDTLALIGRWIDDVDPNWRNIRAILGTSEIAGLWHLPHEGFPTSAVSWISGSKVAASAALRQNIQGLLLGDNVAAGQTNPIYQLDEDRGTHSTVLGKTGTGKSTFLLNLIRQDIFAGRGVGVIDPHGSLVQDILRTGVPDQRIDDVVVIDIANEAFPAPLNLLAVPGEKGDVAAGQVMAVLDKIYGGFQDTPRVVDTLEAALITLWQEKTATVRDVVRLFDEPEYRYQLLNRLDSDAYDAFLEFWHKFERQSPAQQEQISYPVVHRMRSFYRNPVLYPIMCHPDTLDLAGLIARRKIILVSLKTDERKIAPQEQQLLGAVIVSQLQMAAMSRPARKRDPGNLADGQPAQTDEPFFMYIDEAQEFVTTALEKMLSQVLKFGLRLTLANQFLGQLKGKTLEALMGNVGMTVVFQAGHDDARELAPYFRPEFSADDLVNLPLHRAAVKMRYKGQTLPAFSLDTTPPVPEPPEAADREALIRQRSIGLYTPKGRDEVMAWLRRRYPAHRFGPAKTEGDKGDDWVVPSSPAN